MEKNTKKKLHKYFNLTANIQHTFPRNVANESQPAKDKRKTSRNK